MKNPYDRADTETDYPMAKGITVEVMIKMLQVLAPTDKLVIYINSEDRWLDVTGLKIEHMGITQITFDQRSGR